MKESRKINIGNEEIKVQFWNNQFLLDVFRKERVNKDIVYLNESALINYTFPDLY